MRKLIAGVFALSIASSCVLNTSSAALAAEGSKGERQGRFFESLDQAHQAGHDSKKLQGHLIDNSLKAEDDKFQEALQELKAQPDNLKHIYDDLVRSNAFVGNPVLIRIDPPDEEIAQKNVRELRAALTKLAAQENFSTPRFPEAKELINAADLQYYNYLCKELNQAESEFRSSQQDENPVGARTSKYLLILNYNIPAVKAGNFKVVRFGAHALLRTGEKSQNYELINLISVYPTAEILTAGLTNTTHWELQAERANAPSGHVTVDNTRAWQYNVNLPRVIGFGTNDGAMQWVYYPAKSQEITFGNKTAFALFTVPADLPDTTLLQINALLEYSMKAFKFGSTGTERRLVSLYTPLSQALHRKKDIDTFTRMFGRTLSASDERTLQRLIHANDPAHPVTAESDAP